MLANIYFFVSKISFVKSLLFFPNLPHTSISGSRWCRNDREASFEIKGALAQVLNQGSIATRVPSRSGAWQALVGGSSSRLDRFVSIRHLVLTKAATTTDIIVLPSVQCPVSTQLVSSFSLCKSQRQPEDQRITTCCSKMHSLIGIWEHLIKWKVPKSSKKTFVLNVWHNLI